ncbi:MAG: heme exporter protein CcmD [Ketobacteraceae bacterium]|nr:heme exporter protein CcmD [Ketobacteraceae bacterium]
MAFESLSDFMSMCYVAPIGDTRCHGGYVWTAYGIGLLVIAGNIAAVVARRRQTVNQIRRRIRREQSNP